MHTKYVELNFLTLISYLKRTTARRNIVFWGTRRRDSPLQASGIPLAPGSPAGPGHPAQFK